MQALLAGGVMEGRMNFAQGTVEQVLSLNATAYGLAVRILSSRENAEDVVQEAYLSALHSLRRGSSPENPRAWFLAAVANTARKHLRTEIARTRREAEVRDMTDEAAGNELIGPLRTAMEMLEAKYRVPVSLSYEYGHTQREIAAILKTPERTVSEHVKVGLAKLRKALGQAGYPAAVAALLGGLKQTAPVVPASLAASVEKLMAGQVAVSAGTGAALVTGSASAAAKGGLAMKIFAGIVLAGAVAVGVAVVSGRGDGAKPLRAERPSTECKDPPADQKYTLSMVAWTFLAGSPGCVTNGPAGQAEDVHSGVGVDNVGNWYWTSFAVPHLRSYRKDRNWVTTVAGSARGYLDGPLERARFSGAGYNQSNLVAVSADGKHIFFRDPPRGAWRHVDFETGMMNTIGEFVQKDGGTLLWIVRDKAGDVYAFRTDGKAPPDCKGYRKLTVAPWKKPGWQPFDGVALDVEKMRFYYHCRAAPFVVDLKTGTATGLTSGAKRKEKTGSLKGASFWCSSGLSISARGRYLFMGGGDDQFCWRLDLEGDKALIIGRDAKGDNLMFREQGADFSPWRPTSTAWPANPIFEVDGLRAAWPTQEGLFRLAPVK